MRDPTISFEDGTALVDAGCNTRSVRCTTSGNQITFDGLDLQEDNDGDSQRERRAAVRAGPGRPATVELDTGSSSS